MLKTILIILGVLLLAVILYLLYVLLAYHRIPDRQSVPVLNRSDETEAPLDTPLSILTYNVGFAAYTKDFSFFMDDGK